MGDGFFSFLNWNTYNKLYFCCFIRKAPYSLHYSPDRAHVIIIISISEVKKRGFNFLGQVPTTVIVFDSYFVSPLCLYMARPLSSGLLSHFLKSLYCYQIISDGSPQIENGKRLNWPAIIKFNFLLHSILFLWPVHSVIFLFLRRFFLRRVCRRSGWKKGLFSIRTKYKFLKVYLRLERNGGACLSCVCVRACV